MKIPITIVNTELKASYGYKSESKLKTIIGKQFDPLGYIRFGAKTDIKSVKAGIKIIPSEYQAEFLTFRDQPKYAKLANWIEL